MSKKNNKGFTLMEMLIVVAIIAILIAIAIPTFSTTLEKARESTDAANIRAAYSEAASEAVTSNDKNGVSREVELTQSEPKTWANDQLTNTVIGKLYDGSAGASANDCTLANVAALGLSKGDKVKVTVYSDGSCTVTAASGSSNGSVSGSVSGTN